MLTPSVRARLRAADEPGFDHAEVGADAGPGLRDVLAVLDREMAGRQVRGSIAEPRRELGLTVDAGLACLWAPGVEPASRWRVDRRRHVADQDDLLALADVLRVGDGHRGQQRVRVGVPGMCPELLDRCLFYLLPEGHDRYRVADVPDDRKVVGDED